MTRQTRPLVIAWACCTVAALAVSGCHKKDNVTPVVVASASPSASESGGATESASASATDSPSPTPAPTNSPPPASASFSGAFNQSITLSSNGYAGTLVDYAGGSSSAVNVAFALTTNAPTVPSPAPTGSIFLSFTVQLTGGFTFSGSPISPVVLPSSISTSSSTFVETVYDQTAGAQVGSSITGFPSGQSISFVAPSGDTFTFNGSDVYLITISSY